MKWKEKEVSYKRAYFRHDMKEKIILTLVNHNTTTLTKRGWEQQKRLAVSIEPSKEEHRSILFSKRSQNRHATISHSDKRYRQRER